MGAIYDRYIDARDRRDRASMCCEDLDSAKYHATTADDPALAGLAGRIDRLLQQAQEIETGLDERVRELEDRARWECDEELAHQHREYESAV